MERVEGPAAGEVALEVEDVKGGGESEGEGVEPGAVGLWLVEDGGGVVEGMRGEGGREGGLLWWETYVMIPRSAGSG